LLPRILTFTADLPPAHWSGIGIAVANQACALASLGCTVDLLTSVAQTPLPVLPGVNVRILPRDAFPADIPRPDCVSLHSLALAPVAIEAARRFRAPLVYTAHSSLSAEPGCAGTQWERLQSEVFERADHVFFLNCDEREQVAAVHDRSSVLAHGVPAGPSHLPAGRRARLILFAGRFCYSKGTDVAVAAVRLLLSQDPQLHVVFAGGHGEPAQEEAVSDLARKSAGRVTCAGWLPHPELQRLIARAALVMVPSRYEPFGLVALEALRASTPVLAADVGGLHEIIRPGSGGLLLANHDPAFWAQTILDVLADPSQLNHLSLIGPLWVAKHYDPRRQAQAFLDTLGLNGAARNVA
jgi:glycosyltransferase involved in cell wall biosynthesis